MKGEEKERKGGRGMRAGKKERRRKMNKNIGKERMTKCL